MWPVQKLLKPAYDLVSNHIYCGVHKTMIIQLPVMTAVLEKNDDLCPSGKAEDNNKIIIEKVNLLCTSLK